VGDEQQHEVARSIVDRFTQRTQGSRGADDRAKQVLPGGDTRSATYYPPYPAYMERGDGCRVYDYDENEYIDFLNNYTSLIHGHGHPGTVSAVREQVARGTVLGSASHVTLRHAEMLCDRIPSLDAVRYCNSGTEATLMAIRAARAFSEKDVIVKMDGGYHGAHDSVQVNIQPDLESMGLPQPRRASRGVPASVLADVLVVPFNDLVALEHVLQEHAREIAAIILEPVLGSGGGVDPQPGFLQGARALADRFGVLLIFDEVLTFRLDVGGAQSIYGVTPDLTALGKIIGGGLPVGAFGGRQDIMASFDPMHPKTISHSGTFNGNNLTMAAGLATMADYDAGEVARINELGQRLKQGINEAFQSAGVVAHASGMGSLVNIHWQKNEVKTSREAVAAKMAAKAVPRLVHLELMNQGIFCASRLQFAISTPMTEREVDQAAQAFQAALSAVRPYMAEQTPHLVATSE